MMTVGIRDIVAYILSRTGCLHPFRISRIMGLAEILGLKENGKRLFNLVYKGFDKVFYIEGLKDSIDDECFNKVEGDPVKGAHGCIEYNCAEPRIPEDVKTYLDLAIEKASGLSDEELNSLVVNDPLFSKLLSE